MKDSVDELLERLLPTLQGIDPITEGIITRLQLIVRYLSGRKAEALQGMGVQMWECATLYALRRRGEPYAAGPTALAAELGVTGAAMTTRIDTLQRRGFVVRRYDRADRRRSVVALTGRGLALAERIMATQAEVEHDVVATLTASQLEQLTALLRRLMRAVDAGGATS